MYEKKFCIVSLGKEIYVKCLIETHSIKTLFMNAFSIFNSHIWSHISVFFLFLIQKITFKPFCKHIHTYDVYFLTIAVIIIIIVIIEKYFQMKLLCKKKIHTLQKYIVSYDETYIHNVKNGINC